MLNLYRNNDRFIRLLNVLISLTVVVRGTPRSKAADALRRIFAGGNRLPGFLHRANIGDENSTYAQVKDLLDGNAIVPRDTHERHRWLAIEGHEDRCKALQSEWGVLGINDHPVKTDTGHHLGDGWIGEGKPGSKCRFA